ncbi:hypothetical protein FQN57_004826 [Myotisia sp. PD_48]|nr:hypothetical protein FQN57_004826 [Myotisia sp. PD_48]
MADACAAIILIIVTILVPPVGVFFISGCSPDLLINIILTLLGYFPGHIHAFYCEYVYYDRKGRGRDGRAMARKAPGIFSKRIQNGGEIDIPRYVDDPQMVPARFAPNPQVQNNQVPVVRA